MRLWGQTVGFAVSKFVSCFQFDNWAFPSRQRAHPARRLDARLKASSELCDDLTEIMKGASAPAA